MKRLMILIAVVLGAIVAPSANAFAPTRFVPRRTPRHGIRRFADKPKDDSSTTPGLSFDEAGAGLIQEEDTKKLQSMGDYDSNPNSSTDEMDRVRAAIRARTKDLGLEKSTVSAEYIRQRQEAALSAGSARAAAEQGGGGDYFGGLDVSQIRSTASTNTDDNADLPTMFFDPDEKLSKEEQIEADPLMAKSSFEQGLTELQKSKWPDPGAALRKVFILLFIVALTGAIVIGWDKVVRDLYTDVLHFIPSKAEIADYANRFDGLGLPDGWMDNMNSNDVSKISDAVTNAIETTTTTTMPEL